MSENFVLTVGGSRFWFWPLSGIKISVKISVTAIAVTEIFTPKSAKHNVQKAGLDFWFFDQQNQKESVRFRS